MSPFLFSMTIANLFGRVGFNVLMKKVKERELFFFWGFAVGNILFISIFFLHQFDNGLSFYPALSNLGMVFREDLFFYSLRAIDFMLANIVLFYLLERYTLSSIVLVFQVTVLTSALSYYILGSPLSTYSIIGALIVTVGAVISGFKKFTFPNILEPLKKISLPLFLLGFCKALLTTTDRTLLFMATQKTAETIKVHQFMAKLPFASDFPVVFSSTFNYAVGIIPPVTILYFLYLKFFQKINVSYMFTYLKKHFKKIVITGLMYFIYIYFFIYVFQHLENKLVLTVIEKLTLPLNLIFAYLFLNEKISLPQKVATGLILCGGFLSTL